ncbi:MAG: hypothetical protein Tsb0021_15110 [Chlamydiales bacterium]
MVSSYMLGYAHGFARYRLSDAQQRLSLFRGRYLARLSTKICCPLIHSVQKIFLFFLRYQLLTMTYAAGLMMMRGCRVTLPNIAMSLIPSLVWQLFFVGGSLIATDLVQEVSSNNEPMQYVPQQPLQTNEDGYKELNHRYEIHQNILKKIIQGRSKSYLISGISGSGKSEYVKYLAQNLKKEGYPVFMLKKSHFRNQPIQLTAKGTPYDMVKAYLKGIYTIYPQKRPILIIDEAYKIVDPSSGSEFLDSADEEEDPFHKIFIMEKGENELSNDWKAFLRRVDGNSYEFHSLNQPEISKTLQAVRIVRYHPSITDETITEVVKEVWNKSSEEKKYLCLDRSAKLLKDATETSENIDLEMIKGLLEEQTWYNLGN